MAVARKARGAPEQPREASTKVSVAFLKLRSGKQWVELRRQLDPNGSCETLAAHADRLEELGVRSALVEYDYLDRDFSAEFAAYYAKLFHRYDRETRRYHFFLDDIGSSVGLSDSVEVAKRLRRASDKGRYLGFVVIRPITDSPIAKAVLDLSRDRQGPEAQVQVRASYETHLLGATLRVDAFPFTEQDRRMASCAHAALWVCARHFQARHGSQWLSIPAIADAAATPMDVISAQSLPAGAQGLHPDNLTRALKGMGRHPLAFTRVSGGGASGWPKGMQPQAILARYVESGIPVILGLNPRPGGDGHAVVACGTVRGATAPMPPATKPGFRRDVSCLISDFLVHDDQAGPALRMSVGARTNAQPGAPKDGHKDNVTLERDVFFILIPVPERVYVPAESAELKAWSNLDSYVEAWDRVRAQLGRELGTDVLALGHAASKAWLDGRMVARTYLILGWKYKRWLLSASASETLRSNIMLRPLPKLLWVTEFGAFEDLNHQNPLDRRIMAHCAVDATTTGSSHPPLLFHGPGLLTVWNQAPGSATGMVRSLFPIPDDRAYVPRFRTNRLRQ